MVTSGADFVRGALKKLGVLDPIEPGADELIADGIVVANDMLDSWRGDKLTIRGITRAVYTLVSGQQTYTIGTNGDFDQDYPESIEFWGVIPNATASAATRSELPMGRALNYEQYGQIRTKGQTGAYPNKLYFDRSYAAGLGNIIVVPVPDSANAAVALYCRVPSITQLVLATQYDLPPGLTLTIKLNLAVHLAPTYSKKVTTDLPDLKELAKDSLGAYRRSNIIPKEGRIRSEFVIGGTGGRARLVREGGLAAESFSWMQGGWTQ